MKLNEITSSNNNKMLSLLRMKPWGKIKFESIDEFIFDPNDIKDHCVFADFWSLSNGHSIKNESVGNSLNDLKLNHHELIKC